MVGLMGLQKASGPYNLPKMFEEPLPKYRPSSSPFLPYGFLNALDL